MKNICEFLNNSLTNICKKDKSLVTKLKLKSLIKIRRFLINKNIDPIIKMNVFGTSLKMPFSHDLPIILSTHEFYAINLGRIAQLISTVYTNLCIIDVGANIGDTVAILRNYLDSSNKILCIEGDGVYYKLLRENLKTSKNVYYKRTLLGEYSEAIKKKVKRIGGTGHIENTKKSFESMTLPTVLEESKLNSFRSAKLLKIDTDGFDNKILRGAKEYLISAKPVIFFEYDVYFLKEQGEDALDIFDYLSEIGYERLLVYDNYGVYVTDLDISDKDSICDLNRLINYSTICYYDLCVFHKSDKHLLNLVKEHERAFFSGKKETL